MSRDYSRPITISPSDQLSSADHLLVVLNTTSEFEDTARELWNTVRTCGIPTNDSSFDLLL